MDNLLAEVRAETARGNRILVTTLTKRMAEDLTEYYHDLGVKVRYLHADIKTLERAEIIRDLRRGVLTCWSGSTCCGRAWIFRRSGSWLFWMPIRKVISRSHRSP